MSIIPFREPRGVLTRLATLIVFISAEAVILFWSILVMEDFFFGILHSIMLDDASKGKRVRH